MTQDITALYAAEQLALNGLLSQARDATPPDYVTASGSAATFVSSPSLGPAIVPDLLEQQQSQHRQQQGQQQGGNGNDPRAYTDSYVHKSPIASTELVAAQVAYSASAVVANTPSHVLDIEVSTV